MAGKIKNQRREPCKRQRYPRDIRKMGTGWCYPVQSQEQDSSGTVRQLVSQTPGAISYLAFSYLDDSTQALSIDGVEPKEENVADNSWGIWSYEHMYTNGKPSLKSKNS